MRKELVNYTLTEKMGLMNPEEITNIRWLVCEFELQIVPFYIYTES